MAQQHLRYQTLTLQASLEDLVRLGEDSLLVCLEEWPGPESASAPENALSGLDQRTYRQGAEPERSSPSIRAAKARPSNGWGDSARP